MRQAISTKYLAPTNHKGARIKATCDAGSVTIAWEYEISDLQNYAEAARALCLKLGWTGKYVMGGNGGGYTFVLEAAESFGFQLTEDCLKATNA